ncbi:SUMO-interacting motif-containing protein 1 isoform X2 [Maylandia zebra]|uniref:SUMO-interacting motif-containing protein 1 isoform X2 n=1 Tax=Maylandia zebra TaxID=106582 RepID=UPI00403C0D40
MDDVISLSSDDSDVEIVGSYCTFTAKPDPMPLSAVRVEVDAVKLALPPDGQENNSEECTNTQVQDDEPQHLHSPADSPRSVGENSVASSKEHSIHDGPSDGVSSALPITSIDLASSSQDIHDGPSDGVSSALPITSIDLASSSQDEAQMESPCSDLNQPKLEKSRQPCSSGNSSPFSPTTASNSSEPFEPDPPSNTSPISHSRKSPAESSPRSESAEDTPEWQLETETYKGDLGLYSPGSFPWEDESDGEDMNEETMDCRAVSREDRHFVCPSTLRKLLAGTSQKAMFEEDDEDFVTPEVLCRQSLSLVYSTIDENYPEGTLQLLSDLLQPGYYPPRDITSHLLHGILLDLQSPHHLCVQAFKLLMRSQRHHMVDKNTVPWDWELLTSVMTDEEHTQRHRCDVVRMFLEYIVQTLEDDFRAKCSTSSLHHSIAKATLSCDQQFPRVREVIKWLFSAIMKSTEHGKGRETTQEREYMRMVSCLQRMLSLALEVDCSPALTSAKLSQELFHMLISNVPLRAHRMLLLESLQSKLLRCKLLEHLLDYACPVKISLPMSLSLLLHFLKHCTVAPDPMDGTEKWLKWEELVHLLWMLLLSYNKAMKGYLCNSLTEPRGRVGMSVYKPDDRVSRPAVQEAVEAFLSRSQADLDQALPLHVEESLTYLQDHLLDVCQC